MKFRFPGALANESEDADSAAVTLKAKEVLPAHSAGLPELKALEQQDLREGPKIISERRVAQRSLVYMTWALEAVTVGYGVRSNVRHLLPFDSKI